MSPQASGKNNNIFPGQRSQDGDSRARGGHAGSSPKDVFKGILGRDKTPYPGEKTGTGAGRRRRRSNWRRQSLKGFNDRNTACARSQQTPALPDRERQNCRALIELDPAGGVPLPAPRREFLLLNLLNSPAAPRDLTETQGWLFRLERRRADGKDTCSEATNKLVPQRLAGWGGWMTGKVVVKQIWFLPLELQPPSSRPDGLL
ncbi:hypothetical protein Bbelb_405390 [Branchiostoma belcheri]|nr:hypothetical protein Bbelb_405390 [Branchiostoma belcheri]